MEIVFNDEDDKEKDGEQRFSSQWRVDWSLKSCELYFALYSTLQ